MLVWISNFSDFQVWIRVCIKDFSGLSRSENPKDLKSKLESKTENPNNPKFKPDFFRIPTSVWTLCQIWRVSDLRIANIQNILKPRF